VRLDYSLAPNRESSTSTGEDTVDTGELNYVLGDARNCRRSKIEHRASRAEIAYAVVLQAERSHLQLSFLREGARKAHSMAGSGRCQI
jgi:hypothetical protein